jgi:hypothetical protein
MVSVMQGSRRNGLAGIPQALWITLWKSCAHSLQAIDIQGRRATWPVYGHFLIPLFNQGVEKASPPPTGNFGGVGKPVLATCLLCIMIF